MTIEALDLPGPTRTAPARRGDHRARFRETWSVRALPDARSALAPIPDPKRRFER